MTKTSTTFLPGMISFVPNSSVPLYRQVYSHLRQAILQGQLTAGTRLPSTRVLAADLSVSRNTVVNAYEQLIAEGYLEGQIGSGTRVTRHLPEEMLSVQAKAVKTTVPVESERGTLSQRGNHIAQTRVSQSRCGPVRAFRVGLPALDAFPKRLWSRLLTRRARGLADDLMAYGDSTGYPPLREAVAALSATRGVRCEPEQVIIVAGAQQAIDLAARLLLDSGDAVWVEEPGYLGAKGALAAAGGQLIPVPVDKEGLNVELGIQQAPQARLVYVSPSHQYPLGVTMSLARRLALLRWAIQADAWILEDDYDSEYRYTGRPLASLQGLDTGGRVIYIGTFSKVLFPALRLGYLVVPPHLVDAFASARALVDRASPALEQAVLTDFIAEGHFARHIRRMRMLYAERQAALIETANERLGGLLEIDAAEAGLHLVGWLPEGVDDEAIAQRLAAQDIETLSVSSFALKPLRRGGLVLGYAAFSDETIRDGIVRMAELLIGGIISRPQHPE